MAGTRALHSNAILVSFGPFLCQFCNCTNKTCFLSLVGFEFRKKNSRVYDSKKNNENDPLRTQKLWILFKEAKFLLFKNHLLNREFRMMKYIQLNHFQSLILNIWRHFLWSIYWTFIWLMFMVWYCLYICQLHKVGTYLSAILPFHFHIWMTNNIWPIDLLSNIAKRGSFCTNAVQGNYVFLPMMTTMRILLGIF